MEKIEIIRISLEVIAVLFGAFATGKMFRYKGIIMAIIEAAKDTKITESEFDNIINEVKKEIYGESK